LKRVVKDGEKGCVVIVGSRAAAGWQRHCSWNKILGTDPFTATNGTMSTSDIPGTDVKRFYRVELLP
jgi:hypothetical protein